MRGTTRAHRTLPGLYWPFRKKAKVRYIPIQVPVLTYESAIFEGRVNFLEPGKYDVAVDETNQFIVGLMVLGLMCPFVERKKEHRYAYVRVKMLIEGNKVVKTETILQSESVNKLYYRKLSRKERKQIRDATLLAPIVDKEQPKFDPTKTYWVKYVYVRHTQTRPSRFHA
ncbi:uncharacterized protein LOC117173342 [Belonocnema kinseyi]|uniref:uncharacterized protein LOC117173342 n=1 Tax=Belonocnema kinseyi TaxID=2817044 RepID=UPI00143DAB59|nr:uncharacterized protein LOC117173342 [Belonocnema kinseyi]